MEKEIVSTNNAPEAIGPYSQAVKAGNLVFISGQIPLDHETGKVVDGDIGDQTRKVMKNLGAILEASGSGFDRVIKTTIYLSNIEDFGKVNEVYSSFFHDAPPARATVGVSNLPKGVAVEIEAVALV